ncbi:MAG: acyl-ACP--UDP-N-acetylglucosamine O-acyltransferase [Verrucomicrobiota bacterium]
MSIHPTAIIHPEAQIAADVQIGAYVCIEAPVIIGSGCTIQAHAILTGGVRMGNNNLIGYGAVIGGAPQALSFSPGIRSEVVIGDGNTIREYATIHRSMKEGGITRIGDHNFLMAGTHLGHDCLIGNQVIIANNVLLGGHVEIRDRAFIGGGAVFHQFVRVGELVVAQGNSAFSKDIPPYLIAAEHNHVFGLNVVGLRRAGLSVETRQEIKEAFKLLFKSGLNTRQALAESQNRQWSDPARSFFDFVESAKKRGICFLSHEHRDQNGD